MLVTHWAVIFSVFAVAMLLFGCVRMKTHRDSALIVVGDVWFLYEYGLVLCCYQFKFKCFVNCTVLHSCTYTEPFNDHFQG